jgi:predicted ester cyclase
MSGHDSAEANAEVVRRVEAAWQANDMDAIDQLIAHDFVAHTPGADQLPPGRAGAKAAHEQSLGAMVGRETTIEDLIAEGDRVVARVRLRATNSGTGFPWFGAPANGNPLDFEWITEYRLADGKVVETWAQIETAKFMQQLGVMPGGDE